MKHTFSSFAESNGALSEKHGHIIFMRQTSDQQKKLAGVENVKAKFKRFDAIVSPPHVISIAVIGVEPAVKYSFV